MFKAEEEMVSAATSCGSQTEPFVTMGAAASVLGIHLWALRRAVKAGRIPAYRPFGRPLVRVSEVEAVILATRGGLEVVP